MHKMFTRLFQIHKSINLFYVKWIKEGDYIYFESSISVHTGFNACEK
jgi:hypothetical protein